MSSKSIFRQPGAQHFQLVHRSQRDPLINDPDASQHVLKPVVRENAKKGKSRADLERQLTPSDLTLASERPNIGEATLYGIHFDDTEYDYMQHLRSVGKQDEGFESILVEAPKRRTVSKTTTDNLLVSLRDLPADVFPSASELPRDFESQAAVQSSISGLQPDMDPHLRQTMEALEDDAYVDDGLGDDFFGELIGDGERDANDPFDYEFVEDVLLASGSGDTNATHESSETGWEARFAAFQKEQGRKAMDPSPSDSGSETGDTVRQMPEFSAHGRRRRRRETSDASGLTMSSLSISRSEGLRDLDDRFDKIEKEYMEDEGREDEPPDSDGSDSTPELITSREDFEALMDDFLRNYEVSGGKMKPSLQGSGPEKLQSLRLAMGRDERVLVDSPDQQEHVDGVINSMIEEKGKRGRWDVETVLTTYTNLENHPRLIKVCEAQKGPRIRLDPKTGFPLVESNPTLTPERNVSQPKAPNPGVTTRRPRGESAEEKKERKHAVKAARQARRVEKKENKEQFSAAVKQRSQELAQTVAQVRKL
ncbi:LTV-domain-containing protein [Lactarius akahatsu]|uniref:LTV-domain-containing protein n=1 Tax=Lactarius akahatsu TaxID=416441 RepID=A0AAD4LSC3_9AGAM|nr:LTV-domain-containing protein [Lactarius akahatsu]